MSMDLFNILLNEGTLTGFVIGFIAHFLGYGIGRLMYLIDV